MAQQQYQQADPAQQVAMQYQQLQWQQWQQHQQYQQQYQQQQWAQWQQQQQLNAAAGMPVHPFANYATPGAPGTYQPREGRRASPPLALDESADTSPAPAPRPGRPPRQRGEVGRDSESPPLSGAVGAPPPPPMDSATAGEYYGDGAGSGREVGGRRPDSRGPSAGRRRAPANGVATERRPEWNSDFTSAGSLDWQQQPPPPPSGTSRSTSGRRRDGATGGTPGGADRRPEWNSDFSSAGALAEDGLGARRVPEPEPEAAAPVPAPRRAAAGRPPWLDGRQDSAASDTAPPQQPALGGRRVPSAGRTRPTAPPAAARREAADTRGRAPAREDRPAVGGGGGGGDSGLGRNERPIGGAASYEQMMEQYSHQQYPSSGRDGAGAAAASSSRRGGPSAAVPRDERPVGGARGDPERALPRPVASYDSYEAQEAAMGGDAQMQGGLVPCDICGRNFAANRIEAHMRACAAGGAKPRRVFNAAQQRIGAIEGVTQGQLRAANQEATEKAKAAAAQRMQPPAAKQRSVERSVMLGKDGRPLSPLSAAMARAKAGEDPYDEDPNDIPSDIRPCPCCGRNFAKDRLPKHLEICQKITVNSQQRQTWNSQSQRLHNGQTFSSSPAPARASRRGPMGGTGSNFSHGVSTPNEGEHRAPSRNASTARSADRFGGGFGGGGLGGGGGPSAEPPPAAPARSGMPANKMPKWKRDREALRNAMQSGRDIEEAKANGTLHLMPPPPPLDDEYDDRVLCPHCGRKFNAMAAERHIPKCSSIRAKPKMLVRGGGGGGAAESMRPTRNNGGGRTPTQYVL